MAQCTWCANVPTPLNLNYPGFFTCKHRMGYSILDSAEALCSSRKEGRNLFCGFCGMAFSTPAESTDHAQQHHRRHFCFVCGIEAHLPGRELPGQQHSRVVGHGQNSVKANAKTPSPQIKIKKKVLGHRQRSYDSPYSTQRQNLQVEKDLCISDLLRWLGGLTAGQRASVDIRAAGQGQVVDYLSNRDLLQLALTVRSQI